MRPSWTIHIFLLLWGFFASAEEIRLTGDDGQTIGSADLMVTVIPGPNQAPIVNAGPDQTLTLPGVVTLNGTATDDNLPQGILESSWSKVSGPGTVTFDTLNGVYRASFSQSGTYVLRYTASDTELSGSDDLTVTAVDYIDPPTAIILSPADGSAVTAPTVITGTVSSTLLSNYQLQYRLKGAEDEDPAWIPLSTNTATVTSGRVGALDPTLLLNGIYELRLVATDTLNRTTVSEISTVVVDRNMKIGNFTISFTDINVALSGIPIEIVRSYDSRDKRVGDFGVGWKLGLKNIRLQKNRPLDTGWEETSDGQLFPNYALQPTKSHVISVIFPGDKVYKFSAAPQPSAQFGIPIVYPHMVYTAAPDSQATLASVTGDELIVPGSIPGNVQLLDQEAVFTGDLNHFEFNPTFFKLTTLEGFEYQIDEKDGLKSLTDPNGNTLTITTNGIIHSAGQSIFFQRDELGRITNLVDAAGRNITYDYDASGDLLGVHNQESQVTSFRYDGRHNLLGIQDPRGIEPVRNEYDDSGRLIRHTDAFGKVIEYTHDLNNRQEVVEDRLHNITVNEYDERGNVVRVVDPNGGITTSIYDENDNLLAQTDPLLRTTRYTYDANNNRLTVTDALTNTTSFTYGANRRVTSVTDPRGNVVTNVFDAKGNLLSLRDPLGNVVSFGYNDQGLPIATTNALGHVMRFTYDEKGRLTNEVDALGHATSYVRDDNGNVASQSTTRTTASGVEVLTLQFRYDNLKRLTNTIFPDGSTSSTIYNLIGKPATTIDQSGHATSMEYDELGRVIRTIYADGSTEGNRYDEEGRRIASTNRLGQVTSFNYDALGRLFRTQFPDGTSTTNYFDPAGQLIASTDARGFTTFHGYDLAGRSAALTNALGQVTRSLYDASGNLTNSVDALGRSTTFVYDALNRRVQTLFNDGTTQNTWFDALGRRTHEQDQAGKVTAFGYDLLGRLTSVTNALGYLTRYAYNEVGQQISQTDANLHTTTFEYDSLGRRTKRILPGNQVETYAYSVGGLLTNRTDFNGYSTSFQYDVMNRLLAKGPDARRGEPSITFAYNPLGLRTNMTDASGVTTYQYDIFEIY